jgi:hypothetical protein
MSIEVNYFGSSGVKLRRLTTYNNAEPSDAPNVNLVRPFPKFGGFQNMNAPSHSTYHALQARLQQRFAHGFTLLSSFAYSKSIDNGSGIRTTDGDSLTPSNNYDLELERGLSTFDMRRRWTNSWLWDLPVGKGRRFLKNSRAADFLAGGWQLGGILTLQDGFPLTAYCSTGSVQNGGGSCYPDDRNQPQPAARGADSDAVLQHDGLRRPPSHRTTLPLWKLGARHDHRPGDYQLRRLRQQEVQHQ